MHQELQHCPLCHSGQFRLFIHCKDHSVSQEVFSIQQCQNCQLLFTNPRPAENSLDKYYASSHYISHTNDGTTLVNQVYKQVRKITISQKLKLVERWAPKGELLDIGCGTGHFLNAAEDKRWVVEGVEINEQARRRAEALLEKKIYPQLTDISLTRRFQAITLWHVLEHVYDLGQTLTLLKELLYKQGTLFIAVPNPQSYDAKHYDGSWAGWDVPRHLYHFSQDVMHKLARKHGFVVKEVKPMHFDAFYVSMLSEEAKTGHPGYLKAFYTGLRSNLWARAHHNQYSSLIYILQHA